MNLARKLKFFSDCSVIAVVGPMASGKNYVCSKLEEMGWHSIDADKVVHKAIENQKDKIFETFSETAASLGVNLKNDDGTVNRRALGTVVFSDSKLLKLQEDIVYPEVTKIINDYMEENNRQKIIINATVLFKTPDLLSQCQKIIFVRANPVKRYFRALRRDKLPTRQVFRRFHAQKNLLLQYRKSGIPVIIVKN